MKKRVVLLLTCLFLWVSSIFAQDVPVGVVVAFKKGNSQELNRYLGDKVDLIIHNRTTNADKQTAEGTMANFFAENKVKFHHRHFGNRKWKLSSELFLQKSTEQICYTSNKNR